MIETKRLLLREFMEVDTEYLTFTSFVFDGFFPFLQLLGS